LRGATSATWIDRFNEAGVPCGPINSIDQVFADPQVQHLGIAQPVTSPALGEIRLVSQPVTLSATPSRLRAPPPENGEHTEEILAEFGYSGEQIEAFRREGTV
jgi:crotonobetainyl-CoA:carnitine CoA-transferase CaiB-like acyl-CoA transferase